MQALFDWIAQLYANLGYGEIVFLMALESSLFPIPSEVVMIPAGYRAKAGALDPLLCVGAGTLGSLIGASANYLLARTVGRAFLLRYGRYVLMDERQYHRAEKLFLDNANVATFVGRLLPVIRHLISLPAGVFSMPLVPFVALTCLGAAIWCGILVACGWYFGEPAVALIAGYSHELTIAVIIGLVGFAGWFFWKGRRA